MNQQQNAKALLRNQRKLTYDGIKPLLSQFQDNSRELYHQPQRRHHFNFLLKYEKPLNFQFREDRRGSIKTSEHKSNLNFRMQPLKDIRLPSFQNRKNISKSIHEVFTTLDPCQSYVGRQSQHIKYEQHQRII